MDVIWEKINLIKSILDDYEWHDEDKQKVNSTIHSSFDIIDHFNRASDNTPELLEISKTLSDNYDWYAYEERVGNRTINLFVLRDYETNYLFVYYLQTQITDCF